MNIHDVLVKTKGKKPRKRRGRGNASGLGGTSGRGHKGAKSRSGWSTRYGYEGGQMPIARRLPKRGFNNHVFTTRFDVVNLSLLEASFNDGETVDLAALRERVTYKTTHGRLKILGTGDLSKQLNVVADKFSAAARRKIEAAGGTCAVRESSTKKED